MFEKKKKESKLVFSYLFFNIQKYKLLIIQWAKYKNKVNIKIMKERYKKKEHLALTLSILHNKIAFKYLVQAVLVPYRFQNTNVNSLLVN